MSRREKVITLEKFLRSNASVTVLNRTELGMDDHTVAVGLQNGLAFLRVVDPTENISQCWYRLQGKIADLRDRQFANRREPDLYLVLLTEAPLDRLDLHVQAIARDPYVCRKLILEWARRDVAEVMAETPFWSLHLPQEAVGDVRTVEEVMIDVGLSAEAVKALLASHGETVANRLLHKPGYKPLSWKVGTVSVRSIPGKTGSGQLPKRKTTEERWRISQIVLDGFRAYREAQTLDLDANLVVIYAPNGTGKTSICEGIEWALTGQAHRIAKPGHDAPEQAEPPVRHVERDTARVELTMQRGDKVKRVVHRTGAKISQWLVDNRGYIEKTTISKALDAEVPRQRSAAWIREAFLRYHYLEQGTAFEFLAQRKPKERYELFQLMMGGAEFVLARQKLAQVMTALGKEQETLQVEVKTTMAKLADWERHEAQLVREQRAVLSELAGQSVDKLFEHAWQSSQELGLVAGGAQAPQSEQALAEILDQRVPNRLQTAESGLRLLRSLPERIVQRPVVQKKLTENNARLEALTVERSACDTRRPELHAEISRLVDQQELQRQHLASKTNRLEKLHSLIDLLPQLGNAKSEEVASSEKVRVRAALLAEHQNVLVPMRSRVQALQRQVQEREEEVRALTRRNGEVGQARLAYRAWLDDQEQRNQISSELKSIARQVTAIDNRLTQKQEELGKLHNEQSRLEAEAGDLRLALSERHRLVAALQAQISSEDCPLCGTHFADKESLIRSVNACLSVVPPALKALEQQLAEVMQPLQAALALVDRLSSERATLVERMGTLTSRLEEIGDRSTSNAELLHRRLGEGEIGPGTLGIIEEEASRVSIALSGARNTLNELEAVVQEVGTELRQLEAKEDQLMQDLDSADLTLGLIQMAIRQLEAESSAISADLEIGESPAEAAGKLAAELAADRAFQAEIGSKLQEARTRAAELDRRMVDLSRLNQELEQERSGLEQTLTYLRQDLSSVGLTWEASQQSIIQVTTHSEATIAQLKVLDRVISLLRASAALKARQTSLAKARDEADLARKALKDVHAKVDQVTGLLADCHELDLGLKAASGRLVESREEYFRPAIYQLYHRLNAHPYFNDIKLDIDTEAEEFRVQVTHPKHGEPVGGVAQFYSMAQINIVTLSIFLAQAMLQGWSKLSTIILDDPVQHLDDMNTYALLDLLQTVSLMNRQLIITTSDQQIYKLMLIKFGSLNRNDRKGFKAYRLQGLGEKGPSVIDDTNLIPLP